MDRQGRTVLKDIMKDDRNVKIVVTTGYYDDQVTINQMIKLGAYSFLLKPLNRILLMKVVSDILYNGKIAGTNNQISKSIVLEQN